MPAPSCVSRYRRSAVSAAALIALGASVLHPGAAYAEELSAPADAVAAEAVQAESTTVEPTPPQPAEAEAPAAPTEPAPAAPEVPTTPEVITAAPAPELAPEPAPAAPVVVTEEVTTPTPAPGPVAKPLAPAPPRPKAAKLVTFTGGVDKRYITVGETSTFTPAGVSVGSMGFAQLDLYDNDACTDPAVDTETLAGGTPVVGSAVLTEAGTYYWRVTTSTTTMTVDPILGFPVIVTTSDSSTCGAPGSVVTVVAAAAPAFTSHPDDVEASHGEEVSFTASFTGSPAPVVTWQYFDESAEEWTAVPDPTVSTTGNVNDGFETTLLVPANGELDGLLLRVLLEQEAGEGVVAVTSNESQLFVEQALEITTTTLPTATVGEPYEAQLEGVGGFEDYLWGETEGSELPPGLELDPFGLITGTPTEPGTFEVGIELNDPSLETNGGEVSLRRAPRLIFAPSVPTISSTLVLTVLPAAAAPSVASAPLNVRAAQTGPGQVTITWDPPASTGGSPITGYSVGYGNGGSGNGDQFPATARQAVFNGLSIGDYQASVTAITAAGDGARAFASFSIIGDSAAPGGALPLTGGNSADQLTWALWLALVGVAVTAGSRRRRVTGRAVLA